MTAPTQDTTQHPEKTEHTQPGITLDEFTLDDKIEWLQKNADHDPLNILASLIRLKEIEGDAKRYQWLLADHDDADARDRRRSICENIAVKSYSAVSRDIDLAVSALLLRGKP